MELSLAGIMDPGVDIYLRPPMAGIAGAHITPVQIQWLLFV